MGDEECDMPCKRNKGKVSGGDERLAAYLNGWKRAKKSSVEGGDG